MSAIDPVATSGIARNCSADELRRYVWASDEIYDRRFQKSFDAAAALMRVLAETPLLGGRENAAIQLYRSCMALDGEAIAAVWQDPGALGWAVYAFHSVGVLGALKADLAAGKRDVQADHDHVEAALTAQLEYFKALAIGMHVVAGSDLDLEEPLVAELPFAIPGTRFLVRGAGTAEIAGARNGAPVVRIAGRLLDPPGREPAPAGPRIELVPLITRHGCHLQLNSWCGQVPFIDCIEVEYAARFPARIEASHLAAIEQAIDWIHRYAPDAFEEFRKRTRCLSVKLPQADGSGGVGSASFTFLPGLIHLKLVANPLWLAESFIHESFHNRLFFLDEDTHILREIPGPEVNYSPWRRDRRPPHGILHAIAVFIPVTRFMLDIHRAGVLAGEDAAYALDFVVRQFHRNRMAIAVLEQVGDFTEAGRAIFDEIRRASEELDRDIVAANLPQFGPALQLDKPTGRFLPQRSERDGAPMNSIEALREHIELHDVAGQAVAARAAFDRMLERPDTRAPAAAR